MSDNKSYIYERIEDWSGEGGCIAWGHYITFFEFVEVNAYTHVYVVAVCSPDNCIFDSAVLCGYRCLEYNLIKKYY